ncbi:flavoprotein [Nocardiopsis sp. CNT-189]|uniref:flavoprotein n=1 Tax=Nocardiopsis oceanisediminis TaxID=2816862 RepID=UPI003B2DD764
MAPTTDSCTSLWPAGRAQECGWPVQVIATPAATAFIDGAALEEQTGRPVRSRHREPGQPRSPKADAIVVAPASFNTVNKLAAGIADNYAIDVVGESLGIGVPVVVLPFVNSAYAARAPFRASVESLRSEGAEVLLGPGEFVPHEPKTDAGAEFPWGLALDRAEAVAR